MPTYEYECNRCEKIFEIFQSIKAEKLKECPACGGPITRLLGTGGGIIFKGSGFYETDYKTKKGEKPKTDGAKKETEKKTESPGGKTEPSAPKTETKPKETTTSSKNE